MKLLLSFVFCCLFELIIAKQGIYRAGVVDHSTYNEDALTSKYGSLIKEAGKSNIDILVLPSPVFSSDRTLKTSVCGPDNYEEIVKSITNAAKDGGVYVVAHLYEKVRCGNKDELIRSNLVFDRLGVVVSVKLVNSITNCNTTATDIGSFTTDFGVTFGVLMEEDLVLQNFERFKGVKNFVVTGAWSSDIPFLSAAQFSSSLAYVTNVNLVSPSGIYAGRSGVHTISGSEIVVAELNGEGGSEEVTTLPVVNPTKQSFTGEDMNQYMIRPLDLEASNRGYSEVVCDGKFCCDFYVKTKSTGSKSNVNYSLAVLDGSRHFGRGHIVGTQSCVVLACAGLYNRNCSFGSGNSTNTPFERIVISGNFTKVNSVQFPIILSTSDALSTEQFNFNIDTIKDINQVTTRIVDGNDLLGFGIFGRVFSKDFVKVQLVQNNSEGLTSDIYDYLYSEDVQQFFDYVWIRLRILIFVISIYILEMM